jgi:prevent-host-death family protein
MSQPRKSSAPSWPIAKAKARLTELVDAALEGAPQVISRHGEDIVVVISTKEYAKQVARGSSIADFFANSPLAGVDLALERNRSGARNVEL